MPWGLLESTRGFWSALGVVESRPSSHYFNREVEIAESWCWGERITVESISVCLSPLSTKVTALFCFCSLPGPARASGSVAPTLREHSHFGTLSYHS